MLLNVDNGFLKSALRVNSNDAITSSSSSAKRQLLQSIIIEQVKTQEIRIAIETIQEDDTIIIRGQKDLPAKPRPQELKGKTKIKNMQKGQMFIGVKAYGVVWQVIINSHSNESFRTVLKSPDLAAKVYDRYSIQKNGLKAQTNFSYSRMDLIGIMKDIEHDRDVFLRKAVQQISFKHFKLRPKQAQIAEEA